MQLNHLDDGCSFKYNNKIHTITGQSYEVLSEDPININKIYSTEDEDGAEHYFHNATIKVEVVKIV